MKIGLIYPNEGKKEKAVHIGLASIVAFARLRHDDLSFHYLDTRVATRQEKILFYQTQFDFVGLTAMVGIFNEVLQIAEKIKSLHPQTTVCVGGPYVSTLDKEIMMFEDIDMAVFGEGEETFSDIISYLKGDVLLDDIKGLIFRDSNGITQKNPPRSPIWKIDDLPMPAYDLFDMDRYPSHRIVSSRGCPFKCSFCSSASVWEFKWRKRSPESLADEISYLIEQYGRKTFFFNDDTFNMSIPRALAICDEFIARDLNILWTTPLRADRVTEELAVKMKKAGCYNVGIGIESANNDLLARMHKNTTIEQITEGIHILQSAEIEVLGQFLIGNIGETPATFEQTLAYANASKLDFILFYSVLPYKGTLQWEYVKREGTFLHHVMHDFHSVDPRIVFETPAFSYDDWLQAIKRTQKAGYYIDEDRMSHLFDFGRSAAYYFQKQLPAKIGNTLFMLMKKFYRKALKNRIIKN